MNKIALEICANSLTSAMAAQAGGADRIEICENLFAGGTTPSFATLSLARQFLQIPVHVLIRPRPGDFLYSETEFATMKLDIMACQELKLDGVVIGILTPNGQIDKKRCEELLNVARPMSVTFHRAFDLCCDPLAALEDLIGLGFDRLLTAGQEKQVPEGVRLIRQLVDQAAGRIKIMPGSGITEENVAGILKTTGVNEIHLTAGHWEKGSMQYIHPRCRLSDRPDEDFTVYTTSIERVKQFRILLDKSA
jgi:copper homeostasis protein